MKSLSLSRPLVIMMLGAPGAGKSFFARQFSDTFGAPVVSYDRLRMIAFSEPSFQKDEEDVVRNLANNEINELLKTHRTFIVDGGNSTRTERIVIEKAARENDYGTLVIWVQTDEPTSRLRAIKRSAKRKWDDWNTSITTEQFDAHKKRILPPLPSENVVVISGKHTYATQAKVVLKKLVHPREDTVHAPERSSNNHDQTPPALRRNITVN